MKSVFIIGSRKFHQDILKLMDLLRSKKIKAEIADGENWTKSIEDTFEGEKQALISAFSKIDKIDICYVYSKEGYVGKTGAMEIAYAYARKKELISFDEIEELSVRSLVPKVMNELEIIKYCK